MFLSARLYNTIVPRARDGVPLGAGFGSVPASAKEVIFVRSGQLRDQPPPPPPPTQQLGLRAIRPSPAPSGILQRAAATATAVAKYLPTYF